MRGNVHACALTVLTAGSVDRDENRVKLRLICGTHVHQSVHTHADRLTITETKTGVLDRKYM